MESSEDAQEQEGDNQKRGEDEQEQERTEFCRALRNFRGGVSLRNLEKSRHNQGRDRISKSALSRYESGRTLPGLRRAKHLDTLYGADGKVELLLAKLWHHKWNPDLHSREAPKRSYFHRWPADYSGTVWIHIKPTPDSVDEYHKVYLHWGPWKMVADIEIPADGVYLTTGKAADRGNLSITLELKSDLHIFALFGADEITDDAAHKLDITQKWTWR